MTKVAFQMDHISTISVRGDTSFALALEAQRRGYSLFHYTPDKLFLRDGKVMASVQPMKLYDRLENYYELGPRHCVALEEMDVVLLRQDPPFNMQYLTTTYLLEKISATTLVVNDPFWVRNSPEKLLVTQFAEYMPETLIARDKEQAVDFRNRIGDSIIKPLYGNGGAGVFYLHAQDANLSSLLEMYADLYPEGFILQEYIKEARLGDKRIILVDGEPVGALNRVPGKEDVRCNMHSGGRPEAASLTAREKEICAKIGPLLKERGFLLVGIDVIGDYLTEINVTSPTGVREILALSGVCIASIFWDKVISKRREVL